MSDVGARTQVMLDAWRAQHAERLNPVRFHVIETLQQGAKDHVGEARRILEERLQRLIDAYASDLQQSSCHDSATTPGPPARGALGELVDELAARAAARRDERTTRPAAAPSSFPALPALDEFREIWSRVRTESQLRQSLEHVPTDAGPLNSGSLVHRSLTLMHELAPGYLQHFLAYVDALAGMEQLQDGGALGAREGPHVASPKKRSRGKPRNRPE